MSVGGSAEDDHSTDRFAQRTIMARAGRRSVVAGAQGCV
jgi:hypothetical protein